MTAHEVQLQLPQVCRVDADVGKFAEAGVDAVDGAFLRDDLFDYAACFLGAPARFGAERDLLFPAGDIDDLFES